MEKLTKIQLSVLASYSMPFVLLSAFIINGLLTTLQITGGSLRLVILGAAFPAGFIVGRFIYSRKSHVEITFDDSAFRLVKGSREVASGFWRNYQLVSLVLDKLGKPNLRLYKSAGGEYVDLPISKTNAEPQRFRNHIQSLISAPKTTRSSPQVVEAV